MLTHVDQTLDSLLNVYNITDLPKCYSANNTTNGLTSNGPDQQPNPNKLN